MAFSNSTLSRAQDVKVDARWFKILARFIVEPA
jgi:hypothetical protein